MRKVLKSEHADRTTAKPCDAPAAAPTIPSDKLLRASAMSNALLSEKINKAFAESDFDAFAPAPGNGKGLVRKKAFHYTVGDSYQ
jgi:hypothetical protein